MMLIMRMGIKLLVASIAVGVMLTGCGFRLEGAGKLPVAMTRTYIDAPSASSEFVSSLRIALRRRGSELVNSTEDADSILVVSEDDTGQRVLSVSARNIPREYEIYYAVTIALFSGSDRLMEPETIILTRSYTYDETQVLGKNAEERILREALAEDLARQVLRRIESVATQPRQPLG